MIIIDENSKISLQKSSFIALGSFDGLHLGHLSLINKTLELAKENSCSSMVFTFKNHPLTVVNKDRAPKLLLDNATKLEILEELGIDIACLVNFNEDFMKIEPEAFIEMLLRKYNAKGIIVGFNYRFGYKNKGDINLLKALSEKYGFELHIMGALMNEENIISSTKIRNLLIDGDLDDANALLTRPYILRGTVVRGKQLGRTLGFPTANTEVDSSSVLPKIGVYYTNTVYKSKLYKSITSIGYNPTVNGKNITIETYILNFNKNIYGDELKVYFLERIRNEEKFNSLKELQQQLISDKAFAESRKNLIGL
ncbi:bifunctional riboflavin kinase/FAD synthetase [Clostridium folliculivorans]|uniref:Riboflavin biosynthesis protein n=1 Tax=Clostridium folliculivorans TaxID=2886038 RepID=A0A9W5Y1F8_9CLOT|nr:bifunctional riboflavin kinase/FAD synthetase [Clostridium folliculivorans]GKU24747.1 riboflavin biosynthesis protein [Clostridium folliculivorans]GKU30845.1 riboflavin biosynthesis protein [Clostridium folliculivorans]